MQATSLELEILVDIFVKHITALYQNAEWNKMELSWRGQKGQCIIANFLDTLSGGFDDLLPSTAFEVKTNDAPELLQISTKDLARAEQIINDEKLKFFDEESEKMNLGKCIAGVGRPADF